MDIRRWLDETVLPEQPPSPPEKLVHHHSLCLKETGQTRREMHMRKRSTSDSSLLETHIWRQKISPKEHKADIEENACSDAAHSVNHSSAASASSQPYTRRPRRKTRLERYEPTAKNIKEPGTHAYRRQKGESRKSRRKARLGKGDRPGTGIDQSFHARYVPKDRLTLKPREKLGIFNKGRASSPVKGRGLPDLVFSEMKFLRKHKGQAEAMPKAELPVKKHKRNHAHAREEEISAYFTTGRPALEEKDVSTQAKEGSGETSLAQDLSREQRKLVGLDNAVPTVEIPDKASYLGFGSRGSCLESGSYISWSESIRQSSVTPIQPRIEVAIDVGQLDKMCGDTKGEDVPHLRTVSPSNRNTMDGSDGHFSLFSLAPVTSHVSRSHSLPQHSRGLMSSEKLTSDCDKANKVPMVTTKVSQAVLTRDQLLCTSLPQSVKFENRAVKDRKMAAATYPSSTQPSIPHHGQSSDVLRPHIPFESAVEASSILGSTEYRKCMRRRGQAGDTGSGGQVVDDFDPRTSRLERILRECNSAYNERRRAAASYGLNNLSMLPPTRRSTQNTQREALKKKPYGLAQINNPVRFFGVESYGPVLPNSVGPRIDEDQERRQQFMQQQANTDHDALQVSYLEEAECLEEDGETDYDVAGWEGFLERLGTTGEDFASLDKMEDKEQRHEQREGFIAKGFWRPHKLY